MVNARDGAVDRRDRLAVVSRERPAGLGRGSGAAPGLGGLGKRKQAAMAAATVIAGLPGSVLIVPPAEADESGGVRLNALRPGPCA
jgi:hypothetical protein